jgi:hypothetical protein
MADRRVFRVAEAGRSAFQLRKGEEGLSVFDPDAVNPELMKGEILESFRSGSQLMELSVSEIEQQGLIVVPAEGAEPLPARLRQAHAEIRPGPGMTRSQFKQALKELE